MHDESVGRIVLDPVAAGQHLPALRNVVLLIEDRCALVCRVVQSPEAGGGGHQSDDQTDDQAPRSVGCAEEWHLDFGVGSDPRRTQRGHLEQASAGGCRIGGGRSDGSVDDGHPDHRNVPLVQ
ncbi:Uncharacterised protein [Mycobacteroides abscessus subsp. abscessus]|nr:Uncharacterised protein [Mycobacteroides abscessus subsp. abscessus]